ncbi:hypothetical protein MMC14_001524 [Varicellaria rhodocarpa]|nr:hypothetical protein [Varicellaria rhodocarpa]
MSLRGRKPTNKQVSSIDMAYTRDSLLNMEPFFARSAKAEKLLGPLELFNEESFAKGLTGPKTSKLRRKKTRYEVAAKPKPSCTVDNGKEREGDGLNTQASSPVLGCARCNRHSIASGTDSVLQNSESCSTLQSYYDPVMSPLLVSQQTSASSSRDMALRKGCPRISCAPSQVISSISHLDATNDQGDTFLPHLGAKRRPPKLDLSSLIPRPHSSKGPLFSPERVIQSPSTLSAASDGQRTPASACRRWFSRRGDRLNGSPNSINRLQQEIPIVRNHVPVFPDSLKNRNLHVHNAMTGEETNVNLISTTNTQSLDIQTGCYPETPTSHDSLRPSTSSSIRTLTSQLSLNVGVSSGASQQILIHQENEHNEMSTGDASHSIGSPMFYSDLHTQSVLALSSSEDESDDDLNVRKTFQHRSRGETQVFSICESDQSGSSVYSSTSQYVHEDHKHAKLRSSSLPSWTERLALSIVAKGPHELESNSGSTCPRTEDPGNIQLKELSPADTSIYQKGIAPERMNRFMAVTREEEKLLEAMREKRASMRHTVFLGGNNDVVGRWTQNNSLTRPKTADASKRSSRYLKAAIPSFPAPPATLKYKSYSRGTVSDEDLSKLPDFKSIDDWPLPGLRHSFLSISKGTSEFTPSSFDALPSPMTNHSSPLTPPADQLMSNFSKTSPATSPKQVSYRETRVLGKGVQSGDAMIFDFFRQAQEEQEENELIQWADEIYS